MFEKVIKQTATNCLEILSKSSFIKNFYLAGGTALALQIGHRISKDLDFFSLEEFKTKLLIKRLKEFGKFSVVEEDWGTLHGELNNTLIAFLYYPYPLLYSPRSFFNTDIAHSLDIACMKIDAISSRGTKKDFIDLYYMCQEYPLQKLLRLFDKKYKMINYNKVHILKSLIYFQDARRSPMPIMSKKCSWQEIEDYFQKEVKKIITKW